MYFRTTASLLEVEFEFSIKAPAERSVKDDGFAVWYVNENVSEAVNNISVTHLHNQEEIIANTWSTAYTAENMDLLGYRSKFDGVGVFFTNGGQNKDKATIGGLANDGKSTYNINMGIPTTDAMQYDYRSGNKVSVKMRFRPLGIKIEVVGGPSQEVKCDVKTGGYIGLSVFGGTKGRLGWDSGEASGSGFHILIVLSASHEINLSPVLSKLNANMPASASIEPG